MNDLRTQYRDQAPKSDSSSDGAIAAPPPTAAGASLGRQQPNKGQVRSHTPQPSNANTDRLRRVVENVDADEFPSVIDKLDQILARLTGLEAGNRPGLAPSAAGSDNDNDQFLTPQAQRQYIDARMDKKVARLEEEVLAARAEADQLREEQDAVRQSDAEEAAVSAAELEKLREELADERKFCDDVYKEKDYYKEELRKVTEDRDTANSRVIYYKTVQQNSDLERTQRLNALISELEETKIKLQETSRELEETEEELKGEKKRTQLAEERRRVLFDEVQAMKGSIRVMCRVRPAPEDTPAEDLLDFGEPEAGSSSDSWGRLNLTTTRKSALGDVPEVKKFDFERVFGQNATNGVVFDEISDLVQSAMYGKKVCLFCYGQTGSGKTYTMMGTPDDGGIIPKTAMMLFDTAAEQEGTFTHTIRISVIEIYQNMIHDLLEAPEDGRKVSIRRGDLATQQVITNAADDMALLHRASRYRATAATNANDQSSRSHLILTLQITRGPGPHLEGSTTTGTLNLIDLAGSERTAAAGAAGAQKQEGIAINKDLLNLNMVITALGEGNRPSYDSALTKTLRDSLSESCRALMFVMVSPFRRDQFQTVKTLEKGFEATKARLNLLSRTANKPAKATPATTSARTSTSATPSSKPSSSKRSSSLRRPSQTRDQSTSRASSGLSPRVAPKTSSTRRPSSSGSRP